jgi:outer membrane protein TolC
MSGKSKLLHCIILALLCGCQATLAPKVQSDVQTVPVIEVDHQQAPTSIPSLAWPAPAQTLITTAIQQAADIEIARARLQDARALNEQSFAGFLPQLGLSVDGAQARNRRRTRVPAEADDLVPNSRNHGVAATFAWDLDLFGKNHARWKADLSESQARAAEVRLAQQNFERDLQLAMLDLVASMQLQKLQQALFDNLTAIESKQSALQRVGLLSTTDLVRARAETQTAAADLDDVRLAAEIAPMRVRALTDLALPNIRQSLASTQLASLCTFAITDQMNLQSVHARPDVQAANARLQSALSNAVAAKLDFLPSLQINARYADSTQRDRDIFERLTDALDRSLGVSLAQSLFQGGRVLGLSQSADAGAHIAAAELRKALLSAALALDSALATQHRAFDKQTRLIKAKESADQGLKLARARWKAGIDSELTYLSFKREQLQRELALSNAQASRCQAQINLQAAVWDPVNDIHSKSAHAEPVEARLTKDAHAGIRSTFNP